MSTKIRTLTGIVKCQFPAIFFKNSSDVDRLEADTSALYKGDKNMEKYQLYPKYESIVRNKYLLG